MLRPFSRGLRSNHKGSFLLLRIGTEMKNNFEFQREFEPMILDPPHSISNRMH